MPGGVIVFHSGATVYCGGDNGDGTGAWRGPNVNFARACSSPSEGEMEAGMETPSDILRQESIERWNRVMKALAALYNSYHNETVMDNMLADLDELMQAYDAWLD